jgi:ABC-type branched-subunit amino acid transport system ATPase component
MPCLRRWAGDLRVVAQGQKKSYVVSIIGGNDLSKSTLLRTISGILNATAGRSVFEGSDIYNHRIISLPDVLFMYLLEGLRHFPLVGEGQPFGWRLP